MRFSILLCCIMGEGEAPAPDLPRKARGDWQLVRQSPHKRACPHVLRDRLQLGTYS